MAAPCPPHCPPSTLPPQTDSSVESSYPFPAAPSRAPSAAVTAAVASPSSSSSSSFSSFTFLFFFSSSFSSLFTTEAVEKNLPTSSFPLLRLLYPATSASSSWLSPRGNRMSVRASAHTPGIFSKKSSCVDLLWGSGRYPRVPSASSAAAACAACDMHIPFPKRETRRPGLFQISLALFAINRFRVYAIRTTRFHIQPVIVYTIIDDLSRRSPTGGLQHAAGRYIRLDFPLVPLSFVPSFTRRLARGGDIRRNRAQVRVDGDLAGESVNCACISVNSVLHASSRSRPALFPAPLLFFSPLFSLSGTSGGLGANCLTQQ